MYSVHICLSVNDVILCAEINISLISHKIKIIAVLMIKSLLCASKYPCYIYRGTTKFQRVFQYI